MSSFSKLKSKIFSNKRKSKIKLESDSSVEIEQKMREEREKEKKTIRILLLGPGDSGKTTMIKQIKKTHHQHNEEDAHSMREYIQDSCVSYMQTLCIQSQRLHRDFDEKTEINHAFKSLRDDFLSKKEPCKLTPDIATKIKVLWSDHGIKRTLELRHYYQIHDNVSYFLDQIQHIASSHYLPSFEDYIRIRYRSTGFSQTKVIANISRFGQHTFEFTDVGGQRSERKKWMRFVSEDINAIIYILAISEYDMKLFENNETNRLHEAIELFKTIMVKGQFFTNKPVLLFFNKYDLFQEKIKRVPITVAFDDYPKENDPHDEDEVIKFVATKFLRVFQENKISLTGPLHILRTTALDTDHIYKVFGDITTEIVQHNLTVYGMI